MDGRFHHVWTSMIRPSYSAMILPFGHPPPGMRERPFALFEGWECETPMLGAARSINLISVPAGHLILRRAKDGIYQRRGEDGLTSADISAPRGWGGLRSHPSNGSRLLARRGGITFPCPCMPLRIRYVYYCTYNIVSAKCSTWNTGAIGG